MVAYNPDDTLEGSFASVAMAVSPDDRIMAVSSNSVIRTAPGGEGAATAKYILLSESSEVRHRAYTILVWPLDREGRQVGSRRPMDNENLASLALAAVEPALREQHAADNETVAFLRAGMVKVLQEADATNRVAGQQSLHGHFPSFNQSSSGPVSQCGDKILYVTNGQHVKSGMYKPEEFPSIVIHSLTAQVEGDGDVGGVVTRGRDGGRVGELRRDVPDLGRANWQCRVVIDSGFQNWAGVFSPDGKRILLSGGGGKEIHLRVYDVQTGQEILRMPTPDALRHLQDWARCMAWSQNLDDIAIAREDAVLLWTPTFPDEDTVASSSNIDGETMGAAASPAGEEAGSSLMILVSLAKDDELSPFRFAQLEQVTWTQDDGASQWTKMLRPKERPLPLHGPGGAHLFRQTQEVAVLDRDGCIRFWKL
ncbi:hypothetical protein HDU87_002061 [Geranomyces variabilis]|uniref:Uncharacterized protein n=1 Tax=Geranomyces variabilis TaxID=109894 RepID=A0AAD5XLP1_9FUNG|nr:hypothetical protein HDU87_002061 [Geranomyces variabilis]